jgi:hypothetical protein
MVLAKILLAESINARLNKINSIFVYEINHRSPHLESIVSLPFVDSRSFTFLLEANIYISEFEGQDYRIRLLHSDEGKIFMIIYCGTRKLKLVIHFSEITDLQGAWSLVEKHVLQSDRSKDGAHQ